MSPPWLLVSVLVILTSGVQCVLRGRTFLALSPKESQSDALSSLQFDSDTLLAVVNASVVESSHCFTLSTEHENCSCCRGETLENCILDEYGQRSCTREYNSSCKCGTCASSDQDHCESIDLTIQNNCDCLQDHRIRCKEHGNDGLRCTDETFSRCHCNLTVSLSNGTIASEHVTVLNRTVCQCGCTGKNCADECVCVETHQVEPEITTETSLPSRKIAASNQVKTKNPPIAGPDDPGWLCYRVENEDLSCHCCPNKIIDICEPGETDLSRCGRTTISFCKCTEPTTSCCQCTKTSNITCNESQNGTLTCVNETTSNCTCSQQVVSIDGRTLNSEVNRVDITRCYNNCTSKTECPQEGWVCEEERQADASTDLKPPPIARQTGSRNTNSTELTPPPQRCSTLAKNGTSCTCCLDFRHTDCTSPDNLTTNCVSNLKAHCQCTSDCANNETQTGCKEENINVKENCNCSSKISFSCDEALETCFNVTNKTCQCGLELSNEFSEITDTTITEDIRNCSAKCTSPNECSAFTCEDQHSKRRIFDEENQISTHNQGPSSTMLEFGAVQSFYDGDDTASIIDRMLNPTTIRTDRPKPNRKDARKNHFEHH